MTLVHPPYFAADQIKLISAGVSGDAPDRGELHLPSQGRVGEISGKDLIDPAAHVAQLVQTVIKVHQGGGKGDGLAALILGWRSVETAAAGNSIR